MRSWRRSAWTSVVCLVVGAALLGGCGAIETSPPPTPRAEGPPHPTPTKIDASQAERLKRIMVSLIRVMDHPQTLDQVRIGVLDDPQIKAASAGGGEFYVTAGLLRKANDEQLMAILAHEIAHDDLGHVAKARALGAGLGIGGIILDQIFPGTGQIAPIAGARFSRSYSRKEEYEADRHGVTLLKRIGQPKEVMIDTLTWLVQTEGTGGSRFFPTHPATGERVEAVRKL